jgi:hypothetical protein
VQESSIEQDGQNMSHKHDAENAIYQIRVEGQLDDGWSDWFASMAVSYRDGVSTLAGPVADQAELRGILTKIWDLNLTLISVIQLEPGDTDRGSEIGGEGDRVDRTF